MYFPIPIYLPTYLLSKFQIEHSKNISHFKLQVSPIIEYSYKFLLQGYSQQSHPDKYALCHILVFFNNTDAHFTPNGVDLSTCEILRCYAYEKSFITSVSCKCHRYFIFLFFNEKNSFFIYLYGLRWNNYPRTFFYISFYFLTLTSFINAYSIFKCYRYPVSTHVKIGLISTRIIKYCYLVHPARPIHP